MCSLICQRKSLLVESALAMLSPQQADAGAMAAWLEQDGHQSTQPMGTQPKERHLNTTISSGKISLLPLIRLQAWPPLRAATPN